ncbi:DUF3304 domain-containing protein [Duganella sp. FT109W]|uniref:DUF3304 domain-containing protein n=1 Tax=Duganella margarita TaxID=2692170 RepID=A0ABW9WD88_9BURK|nr:DUF3304 domain-containing protein [Duganella margarita]MYN38951.1 DUF3304 domain-containing protein [Duganella margarita]
MKFGRYGARSTARLMTVMLIVLPMLTACAKPAVPVSVHGVNYAGDEFSYVIEDPLNNKNTAGGETVGSFAAGGTMCCYELPRKWQSGLQIRIKATHWLKAKPDGSLPEVAETKVVEVPPYQNGKVGELWVVRAADGQLTVVSSDFQPDHPNWPGKVKGWPVPSLAYQRERSNLYIQQEQEAIAVADSALLKLRTEPRAFTEEAWSLAKKYDAPSLEGFTGPNDEKFSAHLRQDFETMKTNATKKIEKLKEQRP